MVTGSIYVIHPTNLGYCYNYARSIFSANSQDTYVVKQAFHATTWVF